MSRSLRSPVVRGLVACVALTALMGAAPAPPRDPVTLSSAERRLVAAIDKGAPAALALLERSVNINSGTMNFDGVREVGRLFRPRFDALGFRTRWEDGAAWNRAGHVIAERPGKGPRVLLIGHLDTVFERDSPFQRFEQLTDSTARGPGLIDMKGGIVVMLLALEALAETRRLDDLSLTVVLTGDEEKPGAPLELARRHLIEAGKRADVAIGFEDGAGDPRTAVIARRGNDRWHLEVKGTPAHSSQIFRADIGSGAVFEAARILTAFHDSLRGEPYLTFNPAAIAGGTTVTWDDGEARGTAFGKSNVIAESTVVSGDLRTLSIAQRDQARERMRAIVARHLPGTRATIEFKDSYPPMAPTDGNRRLLERYDAAARAVGTVPVAAVDPMRAGAADVSFVAPYVAMAIDGIGLRGDGGHTVQEIGDLRSVATQAKRVAVLLHRLTRERFPGTPAAGASERR